MRADTSDRAKKIAEKEINTAPPKAASRVKDSVRERAAPSRLGELSQLVEGLVQGADEIVGVGEGVVVSLDSPEQPPVV